MTVGAVSVSMGLGEYASKSITSRSTPLEVSFGKVFWASVEETGSSWHKHAAMKKKDLFMNLDSRDRTTITGSMKNEWDAKIVQQNLLRFVKLPTFLGLDQK